jgi:hypothetical protein
VGKCHICPLLYFMKTIYSHFIYIIFLKFFLKFRLIRLFDGNRENIDFEIYKSLKTNFMYPLYLYVPTLCALCTYIFPPKGQVIQNFVLKIIMYNLNLIFNIFSYLCNLIFFLIMVRFCAVKGICKRQFYFL